MQFNRGDDRCLLVHNVTFCVCLSVCVSIAIPDASRKQFHPDLVLRRGSILLFVSAYRVCCGAVFFLFADFFSVYARLLGYFLRASGQTFAQDLYCIGI